jgi:hypothetical protein
MYRESRIGTIAGLAVLLVILILIPDGGWTEEQSASSESSLDPTIKLTPNTSIQDFQNRQQDVKPYNFDAPPEGLVRSIYFAEGFDEEIGFRRSHEIVPVGVKDVFTPQTPAIYVVFSVFPHYESFQLAGRCLPEAVDGLDSKTIVAEDAMYLALEDESGYLKLHAPSGGWKAGKYKVEIHVGWKINEISLLGTMRFAVQDHGSPAASNTGKN